MHLFLADADPIQEVLPQALFRLPWNLYVTNQMFMAAVAAGLVLLTFLLLFRKPSSDAPHGARNFFEALLEFLRIEVFRPALKEHTDRFLPFLWTLTFFILFCNLLGQIPFDNFATLFTGREYHVFATPTASLLTTGGLAICSFICIHTGGLLQVARALMNGTYGHHPGHQEHTSNGSSGHEAAQDLEHMRADALAADVPSDFRAVYNPVPHYADDEFHLHAPRPHGDGPHASAGMGPVQAWLLAPWLYLWNFAPHPFRPAPGQSRLLWIGDLPMWAMLLILELLGALIKPFALTVRLFANMIAGHLVLASLIILIPLAGGAVAQLSLGLPVTILSLLIRLLELFVAFLQTYIFVFLTALFLASAVAPEH